MSVLIKGMGMPESCCVCPVNMESCNYGFEYLRDHPELYERRAENCPIVEVPTPHGRLIDADAFEANMQNEWERNEISNSEWIHFREMINAEPIIIEAEE